MHSLVTKIATLALLWSHATAFVHPAARSRFAVTSPRLASSPLAVTAEEASEKFYNLEELEDKESCRTEVFLYKDGTCKVGLTDGPMFVYATGEWKKLADDTFRMVLMRKYDAGKETKKSTDMGEFSFAVERIFTGSIAYVGDKVAIEGTIHAVDEELGDREVGFFEMIDSTQERLGMTDEEAADLMMRGKKLTSK